MILHLGVDDVPYVGNGGVTTGDVAQILEDNYGVMEVFVEDTGGIEAIAEALEKSAEEAIESILLGAPVHSVSLTAQAETDIETEFRKYLSNAWFDGLIPGVPTQAALRGVSHRLLHPYDQNNPERPSFIDTGLYQASFTVWVDD